MRTWTARVTIQLLSKHGRRISLGSSRTRHRPRIQPPLPAGAEVPSGTNVASAQKTPNNVACTLNSGGSPVGYFPFLDSPRSVSGRRDRRNLDTLSPTVVVDPAVRHSGQIRGPSGASWVLEPSLQANRRLAVDAFYADIHVDAAGLFLTCCFEARNLDWRAICIKHNGCSPNLQFITIIPSRRRKPLHPLLCCFATPGNRGSP